MGFALAASSVRIWPLIPEVPQKSAFTQVLEFTINMLDTNDVFDVVAECTSLNTAQSLQVVALLAEVSTMQHCQALEVVRASAAAAGKYTLTGPATAPVLTFPGVGDSPTVVTVTMKFGMAKTIVPRVYNVQ